MLVALLLAATPVSQLSPEANAPPVHTDSTRWAGVFYGSLMGSAVPVSLAVMGLTNLSNENGARYAVLAGLTAPLAVLFPLIAGWLTDGGETWSERLLAALVPLAITVGTAVGIGLLALAGGAIYGAGSTSFIRGPAVGLVLALFSLVGSLPVGALAGAIVGAHAMVGAGERARARAASPLSMSVALNPAGGASASLSWTF